MRRLSLLLVFVVAVAGVALVYAGRSGSVPEGHGHHGPSGGFLSQLTEEQRDAIHEKIMEMKDAGASREEIHQAVREMLEGYGIEPPEPGEGPRGPHGKLGELLNEEQRGAIHDIVTEMREAGASREEIHEAVRQTLQGWGIEPPEPGEGPRGPHGKLREMLNQEQREAIHEKVMEMREAGASREDIHKAVREMLEGYGIEPPEIGETHSDDATLSAENQRPTTWGHIKGGFR
jgi:DNA-binding transcriptional regulator YhcF (GntR family)